MKQVAVLLAVLVVALAKPHHDHKGHDHHHHDHHHDHKHHKDHHHHHHHQVGGRIQPWVPFPHFDGIALYPIPGGITLLPGSAFVTIENNQCYRIALGDEQGGFCPLNQTVCDIIANTTCPPSVANATCFEAPQPGTTPPAGQPTQVPEGEFGNGYPIGGPLCHVEALGRKFQPSSYTAIFTLSPKIQTCVFQVAPPPTVFPEPTGEPVLPQDPHCHFVEQ